MSRYQFVWWGWRDWGFGWKRLQLGETDLALIYRWLLRVGPFEVQRWEKT